jgi:hypothetical protein
MAKTGWLASPVVKAACGNGKWKAHHRKFFTCAKEAYKGHGKGKRSGGGGSLKAVVSEYAKKRCEGGKWKGLRYRSIANCLKLEKEVVAEKVAAAAPLPAQIQSAVNYATGYEAWKAGLTAKPASVTKAKQLSAAEQIEADRERLMGGAGYAGYRRRGSRRRGRRSLRGYTRRAGKGRRHSRRSTRR